MILPRGRLVSMHTGSSSLEKDTWWEDKFIDESKWEAESGNWLDLLERFEIDRQEEISIFDIRNLISQCVDSMARDAYDKNISIESFMKEPIFLKSNQKKLEQIFHHILSNAILYNTDSGRVLIHLKESNHTCSVLIQDTGIGIREERMASLFSVQNKSENAQGLTMGLALCKDWIESLKGSIQVSSIPGEGTTVQIALPISI